MNNDVSFENSQAKLASYFAYTQKVETDKELTDLAKLIFGRILYLILFGGEGRCYATNHHLADHFGKSWSTISRCFNELVSKEIFRVETVGKYREIFINHEYFKDETEESKKSKLDPEERKSNQANDPYEKQDGILNLKGVNEEKVDEKDSTHIKFNIRNININKIIDNNNINMVTHIENNMGHSNIFLFSDKTEKDLYIIVSEICEELEYYKREDIKKAILQTVTKSEAYYRMIKARINEPERYKEFFLESIEKRLVRNSTRRITTGEQNTQDTPASQAEFYNGIVSEIRRITLKNMGYPVNKENSSDALPDYTPDASPGETITTFSSLLSMELTPDQKSSVVIEGTLNSIRISKNKYKMTSSFGNLILLDPEGIKVHIQVNQLIFDKYKLQLNQASGERIKLLGNLGYNKYFKHNSIRAVKFLSIGLEEMND